MDNLVAANQQVVREWNQRLIRGEERSHWRHQAYDVIVEYHHEWNEVQIPAGTMRPPVYMAGLPGFFQYGALGAFMGQAILSAVDAGG